MGQQLKRYVDLGEELFFLFFKVRATVLCLYVDRDNLFTEGSITEAGKKGGQQQEWCPGEGIRDRGMAVIGNTDREVRGYGHRQEIVEISSNNFCSL